LRVTTAREWASGRAVNLERALRVGDRLGGHMVQGHVDGVGELIHKSEGGANVVLSFRVPDAVTRYVVAKGSIAIDGVSLTVNTVDKDSLSVGLIPHTLEHTAFGDKDVGARMNFEADMIGKYVERLVAPYRPS
jgi:riboflavin synthase